ncbi:uncharacterized protein B0J16DRAFT_389244 [Fusarium flagelliforme]|uniref:uncharacterized protein n=1 Tax=Fusarium flagelliforme TaxID=2675880 RepID=UPI001E8EDD99|nr:uncharacterized protein B0J16DRAFT_389244 [Fusarium flagelliforme]KAH7173361.1 hypothetical protein B0J16DRAFT_389244 [Fusarium flagelliforme]
MDNDLHQAPIEEREVFNFNDILECQPHHVLYHALRIGLISFSLQAFQEKSNGQTFYHFYFELNEDFTLVDKFSKTVTVCGLALWMECKEDNGGNLNVHFVIRERPFYSPLVSFEFTLKGAGTGRENNLNLLHIIGALQGKSEELTDLLPDERLSNLLSLQWFIRLHKVGYVGWSTLRQTVEDVVLNFQDKEETPTMQAEMFSNIIGHRFTADGSLDDGFQVYQRVYHHMAVGMPYELLWASIWGQGHSEEFETPEGHDDGDEDYEVASDQFDLE